MKNLFGWNWRWQTKNIREVKPIIHWLWTKGQIFIHVHLVWFLLRPSGHWKQHEMLEILVQRVHREHMKPFLLRKNLICIPFGRDPQSTNVFWEVHIETLRLIHWDMMQTEYPISTQFKTSEEVDIKQTPQNKLQREIARLRKNDRFFWPPKRPGIHPQLQYGQSIVEPENNRINKACCAILYGSIKYGR